MKSLDLFFKFHYDLQNLLCPQIKCNKPTADWLYFSDKALAFNQGLVTDTSWAVCGDPQRSPDSPQCALAPECALTLIAVFSKQLLRMTDPASGEVHPQGSVSSNTWAEIIYIR